jgi:hypothetical protein
LVSLGSSSVRIESPTAVLRQSADVALIANRQTNPVDHMTQVQREMIKEQQKFNQNAEQQIQELRQNRPVADLVADVN